MMMYDIVMGYEWSSNTSWQDLYSGHSSLHNDHLRFLYKLGLV